MDYTKMMKEGLTEKTAWGYGRRRLKVLPRVPDQKLCPFSFTAFGYKNNKGKMFLCLRMNVDQISPHKSVEWNDEPVLEKLGELMREFIHKYIKETQERKYNILKA
jgi:hypothetical protein